MTSSRWRSRRPVRSNVCESGLLRCEERPVRDVLNDASLTPSDTVPALNADRHPLDALNGDEEPRPVCCSSHRFLQTEVFMGLHRMRDQGKQVLVLVLRSPHLNSWTISRSLSGAHRGASLD